MPRPEKALFSDQIACKYRRYETSSTRPAPPPSSSLPDPTPPFPIVIAYLMPHSPRGPRHANAHAGPTWCPTVQTRERQLPQLPVPSGAGHMSYTSSPASFYALISGLRLLIWERKSIQKLSFSFEYPKERITNQTEATICNNGFLGSLSLRQGHLQGRHGRALDHCLW